MTPIPCTSQWHETGKSLEWDRKCQPQWKAYLRRSINHCWGQQTGLERWWWGMGGRRGVGGSGCREGWACVCAYIYIYIYIRAQERLRAYIYIYIYQSPGEIKSREVELAHSWTVCLVAELFLSTSLSDTVHLWLCSTQLLKQQLVKYTSCFVLVGSPPLNIYCSGSGWWSLQSLQVGVLGQAIHLYPNYPSPPPPPLFSSLISLMVYVDVNLLERRRKTYIHRYIKEYIIYKLCILAVYCFFQHAYTTTISNAHRVISDHTLLLE